MTAKMEQVSGSHEGRAAADAYIRPAGPLIAGQATLHHLGVAVASISAAAEEFAAYMSARWDGEIFHDPLQQVRVAFFHAVDTRNPVFELVEPASETSPDNEFPEKAGRGTAPCLLRNQRFGIRAKRSAGGGLAYRLYSQARGCF
jgi:hypothetical protein